MNISSAVPRSCFAAYVKEHVLDNLNPNTEMQKSRQLNPVEILQKPNPDVIAELENLLEQAKSGELRSIVYVVSTNDLCTGNGWANIENIMRIIGELRVLEAELINGFVETRYKGD